MSGWLVQDCLGVKLSGYRAFWMQALQCQDVWHAVCTTLMKGAELCSLPAGDVPRPVMGIAIGQILLKNSDAFAAYSSGTHSSLATCLS